MSKQQQQDTKKKANQKELADLRIVQTHLVYVLGLTNSIAKEDVLRKTEYMGQYGDIKKIIINKHIQYKLQPSMGAYVSYGQPEQASLAILSLDHFSFQDREFRAFYGTTKYCLNFIKGQKCTSKECLYLHKEVKGLSFSKDEKFYVNYNEIAMDIIYNAKNQKMFENLPKSPIFPSPTIVITKIREKYPNFNPEKQVKPTPEINNQIATKLNNIGWNEPEVFPKPQKTTQKANEVNGNNQTKNDIINNSQDNKEQSPKKQDDINHQTDNDMNTSVNESSPQIQPQEVEVIQQDTAEFKQINGEEQTVEITKEDSENTLKQDQEEQEIQSQASSNEGPTKDDPIYLFIQKSCSNSETGSEFGDIRQTLEDFISKPDIISDTNKRFISHEEERQIGIENPKLLEEITPIFRDNKANCIIQKNLKDKSYLSKSDQQDAKNQNEMYEYKENLQYLEKQYSQIIQNYQIQQQQQQRQQVLTPKNDKSDRVLLFERNNTNGKTVQFSNSNHQISPSLEQDQTLLNDQIPQTQKSQSLKPILNTPQQEIVNQETEKSNTSNYKKKKKRSKNIASDNLTPLNQNSDEYNNIYNYQNTNNIYSYNPYITNSYQTLIPNPNIIDSGILTNYLLDSYAYTTDYNQEQYTKDPYINGMRSSFENYTQISEDIYNKKYQQQPDMVIIKNSNKKNKKSRK